MKPIDSHSHIYFEQFDGDRKQVLERADKKLDKVVVAGCDPDTNREVLELEEGYPDLIMGNLGLHPTYDSAFGKIEEVKNQVESNDPVAIGEIGLDHHHIKEDELRERQEEVFRSMLELAETMEKPVVVHSREAERKCIEILEEYSISRVMLHCFNGSPDLAQRAVENGWMIGVTTQVLYSSAVQSIVDKIGIENILLETDSPFLYPDGRNEPVHVHESAGKIAELKDVSKTEIVEKTSRNAIDFFK